MKYSFRRPDGTVLVTDPTPEFRKEFEAHGFPPLPVVGIKYASGPRFSFAVPETVLQEIEALHPIVGATRLIGPDDPEWE